MNLNPSKQNSLEKLDLFIKKNLLKYSYLRNFDFGINKRSNTSCLSPYISHGILSELEVLRKSLEKYTPKESY